MAVLTGSRVGDTLVVTHQYPKSGWFWGAARMMLGWTFLWAFVDKLFGLGFATDADSAWIRGGNPATGFLDFESAVPFERFFREVIDSAVIEWMFMIGLALIGLSLMLGIFVQIASWAGALVLMLLYVSAFPPAHNPVVDGHIVYAVALGAIALSNAGNFLGLGVWWTHTRLVQRLPILR